MRHNKCWATLNAWQNVRELGIFLTRIFPYKNRIYGSLLIREPGFLHIKRTACCFVRVRFKSAFTTEKKKCQRSIIVLMNLTTEDLITWLCCIIHFFRFLLFLFLTLSFLFFIDIFNYLSAQHLFRRTMFKREQKKFSKFSRQYPQLVRLPYNGSSFQK